MSLTLRILCVVGAAITFLGITRQVRRAKIKIEDSLFWVLLTGLLVLIAIFPGIVSTLSRALGFVAPSNLVFLGTIGILMVKLFSLSTEVSQLKARVNQLAQEEALQGTEDKG